MKLFARVCVCVVANTFNAIADFNMPHTWLVSALCECAVDVFARCGRSLGTIVSEPADGHEWTVERCGSRTEIRQPEPDPIYTIMRLPSGGWMNEWSMKRGHVSHVVAECLSIARCFFMIWYYMVLHIIIASLNMCIILYFRDYTADCSVCRLVPPFNTLFHRGR